MLSVVQIEPTNFPASQVCSVVVEYVASFKVFDSVISSLESSTHFSVNRISNLL